MQPPSVPPSRDLRFRVRLRTRWSDEDNHAVLNNAVHSTLLEEARYAYFSNLGLVAENRFPFLLLQTNIRFLAPGRGGCEAVVEMGTTHLGRKSFTQAYRILAGEGGEVWCEAEAVLVAWDGATGRSAPMSEEFRRRVEEFERTEGKGRREAGDRGRVTA
ncbi:MAG: thioesterase family protein [Planctomycetota bacterium]